MNKIIFKFNGSVQDNLTWNDLETLEAGRIGASKNILARFIVDESGKPIPIDKAKEILGQLKMKEIEGVLSEFTKLMTEGALNPQTADS